jgi:hypothetical protein
LPLSHRWYSLTATARLASANLIVNGDFETGDFTGWTTTLAASGSNLSVTNIPPAHDTLGARFGATGTDFDSISQTFATTPGALYDLSFFYEIGFTDQLANNHFVVLFNGVNIFDNLNANPGFSPFTFTNLLATASTTTLEFDGRNAPNFDFLDDVSVTASVPEADSSGLLLGLALVGLATIAARSLRVRTSR